MSDYNIGGMGDEEIVEVRAVLVGASEVAAEADVVDASLEGMGGAAETAGRKMQGASRRSFLMGQAMFTMRRFLYQGTLALVAAGGAAVYFGLKFDSNMQQSTIAIGHFLGSTSAAKAELASLYHLAAYTPFQFADVTDAAKSMLSFGFSVNQTNHYLRVMADTMSGLGLSGQSVQQFTNDIVKMAARGKIMGQDIRELVSLHIPALRILQQQLGLTAHQIQNIGQANIPAQTAIDALFRGLNAEYGGLAAKQAKTLQGRISTLKDLTQLMLGIALRPLFDWLQNTALPVVNTIINALAKGFGQGGFLGSLQALNRSNAPFWFKTLYTTVVRTSETIRTLYDNFKPLIMLGLVVAIGLLYLLNTAMGLFNRHATIASGLVWALVAAYVAFNIQTWIAYLRSLYLLVTTAVYVTLLDAWTAAVWLQVAAMFAWNFAVDILNTSLAIMNALLWANPIGLIILAILVVIGLFVLLYFKSKTFRDIIKDIGGAALIVFGYMAKAIEWLIGRLEALAQKIESIPGFHLAMEAGSFLIHAGESAAGAGGVAQAGKFGTGWYSNLGGPSMVPGASGAVEIHTHVHIDRKEVGRAVARYQSDQKAKQ